MLRVLSGSFREDRTYPTWLQGKVMSAFDRRVNEDWLQDDIIVEELRDVEHVVKIDGLMLTLDNGRRIPINWISQGSKQFILMTRNPSSKIIDCTHVGWNVYKYFYLWSMEKDVTVTMLMNSNGALNVDMDMQGLYLNADKSFHSNRELVNLIYEYRNTVLSLELEGKRVLGREFYRGRLDPDITFTGKEYYIDLSTNA